MLNQNQCETLWQHIKPLKTGMLTSWNGEFLHARPMRHLEHPFDGKLYYFTRGDGEKNVEMRAYDDVCVTYTNNHDVWVSISATASITRDQSIIDAHWNPYTAAWFPEGKESPEVKLLVLDVYKAEYWDAENKLSQLFHIAKANVTKKMPDIGENRKLG